MDTKTNKPIGYYKTAWRVESLLGDNVINLKKLKEQAKNGNPIAQFELGIHFYSNAVKGTLSYQLCWEKNLKKAKKWLKKSAKQGHIESQHCLDLLNQHHGI